MEDQGFIINNKELMKDIEDGVAAHLGVNVSIIRGKIPEDKICFILDDMFQAESDGIVELARILVENKILGEDNDIGKQRGRGA